MSLTTAYDMKGHCRRQKK